MSDRQYQDPSANVVPTSAQLSEGPPAKVARSEHKSSAPSGRGQSLAPGRYTLQGMVEPPDMDVGLLLPSACDATTARVPPTYMEPQEASAPPQSQQSQQSTSKSLGPSEWKMPGPSHAPASQAWPGPLPSMRMSPGVRPASSDDITTTDSNRSSTAVTQLPNPWLPSTVTGLLTVSTPECQSHDGPAPWLPALEGLEEVPELADLPQVLSQVSQLRGRGGRQPASDPRLDPKIDPKRAQRIVANRQSAARSKMRQKNRHDVLKHHQVVLTQRHELLESEIQRLEDECQRLEEENQEMEKVLESVQGGSVGSPTDDEGHG